MSYKTVSLGDAVKMACNDGQVYMLTRISPYHTIGDLKSAEGFVTLDQGGASDKPEKKKEIDHGRIVALYTANPPRSPSWIADDMGCAVSTVIKHLVKEGIYKEGK